MPAKLISADAKEFFQRTLWELADSASNLLYLTWLLANKATWSESEKSPKLITTGKTSSNGNWNGNKLGAIKIKGKLFLFKNALFDVTGLFSEEESKLLVLEKFKTERSEIDFLKSCSNESSKAGIKREHIPERIRNEVWRRDGGKCVECGSVYNLEFDHVIPLAKGGSNTARNLRILCEPCNRRKSDLIG